VIFVTGQPGAGIPPGGEGRKISVIQITSIAVAAA
jgi:hypothetical protein